MSVEAGQRLGADRRAEGLACLGERGPGPRADGPPAVMIDGPVPEHLEVLGVMPGAGGRVVEGMGMSFRDRSAAHDVN